MFKRKRTKALVFLSGPMSGLPNSNFRAFDRAKISLLQQGYSVWSPADHDRVQGFDGTGPVPAGFYQKAIRADIEALANCDFIYLLDGWNNSRGSRLEYDFAMAAGIPALNAHLLPRPYILGLSGYAQAGKDTVGRFLIQDHGYIRLAFADALKSLALAVNPALKELVNAQGWEATKQIPANRQFLQDLGVGVRNIIGPDTWVNKAFQGLVPGRKYVITDVRFMSEVEKINSYKGICVRVSRPGVFPANSHVSESELDGYDFDAYLLNSNTLSDLQRNTATIARLHKAVM